MEREGQRWKRGQSCPFVQFWARNSARDGETSGQVLSYYLAAGSAGEILMSARHSIVHILMKTGMLLAALFVFTLLLAALPAHRAPMQEGSPQGSPTQAPEVDRGSMAGMDMGDEHASEKAAVGDMT